MTTRTERPIEVAVIGGGCASMAAAFELTRPEHGGKYHVTVYQMGWRLGGKGASGRGPGDRIEEHGLHVWLGFYENAFRLLREAYAELDRDPATCRFATWRDAFVDEPHVGITDRDRNGEWLAWTAMFPPAPGLPGDPLGTHNPFSLSNYLGRMVSLLRALFLGLETWTRPADADSHPPANYAELDQPPATTLGESLAAAMQRLLHVGLLAGAAGLIEALSVLQTAVKSVANIPESTFTRFVEAIAAAVRHRLESVVAEDDEFRLKWEIIDLVVAILVGAVRFRLMWEPRGLEAIDEYECREWLRMNGASERAVNSAFVRGLYDLALAYENGDPARPGLAAGQALRGSLRMFFTYRGSMFWKMRAGMGDVVFSPFYEALKKRGVSFTFFHRLENVRLVDPAKLAAGEKPYVEALEFDVQARIEGGREYRPLVDVHTIPSWPAWPDYAQLEDGKRLQQEGWDFESHWDTRKVDSLTLEVTRDFDFVVFGASVGTVPHVCKELVARDPRWRDMVAHVKTVASQAVQIWMNEDMADLGWTAPPVTLSAFVKPFDTWADMGHLVPEESYHPRPKSIAYFCNVLADPPEEPDRSDAGYPKRRADEVKRNGIAFLDQHIGWLWPKAARPEGGFRWDLLAAPEGEPEGPADEGRFDTQYWRANVNPTDRYVLALPGTLKYRISPLDNTYDNLTICGDWTDAGFNEGCVEAAVISGRLAAHAISEWPPLEDIIGYDHP
jgi:uncharacterized protein with NAD-binding domain and iron-sulfur cluster